MCAMIRVGNYKGYYGMRMMEMIWENRFINVNRRLKYRLSGWINSMHMRRDSFAASAVCK